MTCRSEVTDMQEIRIADKHPMIVRHRAEMGAVMREIQDIKKHGGSKYRQRDLETKLNLMREELKSAYYNLHKAGWK